MSQNSLRLSESDVCRHGNAASRKVNFHRVSYFAQKQKIAQNVTSVYRVKLSVYSYRNKDVPFFKFSDRSRARSHRSNGYRFATAGTLTLTHDKLTFTSALTRRPAKVDSTYHICSMDYDIAQNEGETEPVEEEFMSLSFPVRNFVTVANIPGDSLDIYDEKHTYRMMFPEEKASTKMVLAIEELNKELLK